MDRIVGQGDPAGVDQGMSVGMPAFDIAPDPPGQCLNA